MITMKGHSKKEIEKINRESEINRIRRTWSYIDQMFESKERVSDLRHGIDSEMLSGVFFRTN